VNDRLSLQRLTWLLRNETLRNYRSWALVSGTVALLALLLSALGALDGNVGNDFYQTLFIATLFAWGTIATSQVFADLHGRGTSAAFLLLPASALEKTVARLFVHTVALFVYLLVLTTLLSLVLEGINAVSFGVRRELFSPLDRTAWSIAPHYLAVQSVFFLGAAWFRKLQFVKTVGAALAIAIGWSLVVAAIALVFRSFTPGQFFLNDPTDWLVDTAPTVYHVVLPVFCWFVAWLRVTEAQVSHGI
jgi:hypothetical protein